MVVQGESILPVYQDLAAFISETTRAVAAELEPESANIIEILRTEIEVCAYIVYTYMYMYICTSACVYMCLQVIYNVMYMYMCR